MLTRRSFLQHATAAFFLPMFLRYGTELRADIVIAGGGLGGVAAALAALRNGRRVILTEATDWIGGQVTAQAVPLDEHPWIESFGCTRSYRTYRNALREYYREHYPLTLAARMLPQLNPGNAAVTRLAHEPRVSLAVLEALLAPYAATSQLTLLLQHKPIAAEVDGDFVRALKVKSLASGAERVLHAKYFLDATELGELLPLTRTEYVTGFESQQETGELHAPQAAQPHNMQACTWCFAMEYRAGEDHTITKPEEYAFWRDYKPQLKPAWPGKLLELQHCNPQTLKPLALGFDPEREEVAPGQLNLMSYRRIFDKQNFESNPFASNITIVNWPMNDYFLGPLYEVPEAEAQRHGERARQLSLSLLYWLQTEAPRPNGKLGWPGLRLRPDVVGTEDGLAKTPYIREARRIRAEFTVSEQHVGTQARAQLLGMKAEAVSAEIFHDSVGLGSYRIDLHMSTGGDNYIDVSSLPFQIPLGALIPQRMENLLPACKNIGTTHITNGCYRLHPVEWNIGEAAGMLAAHAVQSRQTPRRIRNEAARLAEFQSKLRQQGFELEWPKVSAR